MNTNTLKKKRSEIRYYRITMAWHPGVNVSLSEKVKSVSEWVKEGKGQKSSLPERMVKISLNDTPSNSSSSHGLATA